jgi:catechol-2,3-dioxygenase
MGGGAPGRGIPVTGVSELVLEVVDLDASERFYAEVLGLPVVERWEQRGAVWLMAGERTRIGLWRPQVGLAGGRGGVHVHFALHIAAGDLEAAVARIRERGGAIEEISFEGHSRAAYIRDPDGNVVELWSWDVAEHLHGRS